MKILKFGNPCDLINKKLLKLKCDREDQFSDYYTILNAYLGRNAIVM